MNEIEVQEEKYIPFDEKHPIASHVLMCIMGAFFFDALFIAAFLV